MKSGGSGAIWRLDAGSWRLDKTTDFLQLNKVVDIQLPVWPLTSSLAQCHQAALTRNGVKKKIF
jgi:hypothetical protein